MKILGLIPARGGSKGIPNKNRKVLNGKPLLQYTIEATLNSKFLDRVVFSSEDDTLIKLAKSMGVDVPFVRPSNLSKDNSGTLEVVQHALKQLEEKGETFDAVCLLQVTNPFRTSKFIDKAIDSVIKQILNYDWELLIADDASNDDTSEIVKKWVKKYQSNIFYHQNEKNIGLQKNYVKIRNKCNGQYIAHLEADDYWIDPMKTSKQIKLLDEHPDMTWCFTNGQKIDNQGKLIKEINNNLPSSFDFYFFLKNKLNPLNNSIIYRNNLKSRTFPKYFFSIIQWDVVLMYQMSLNSIIGFVPVNGLAWRRHENATSFSKEFTGYKRYKDWMVINEEMKKILDIKFHKFFTNK